MNSSWCPLSTLSTPAADTDMETERAKEAMEMHHVLESIKEAREKRRPTRDPPPSNRTEPSRMLSWFKMDSMLGLIMNDDDEEHQVGMEQAVNESLSSSSKNVSNLSQETDRPSEGEARRRDSHVSDNTHPHDDFSAGVVPQQQSRATTKPEVNPNDPHPALDFPPLYFAIKRYPRALDAVQSFYRFRWRVSYPLQRRVLFSKILRRIGIYLTWGELLLLLPFFAALIVCTLYSFASPSVSVTGHTCRIPLIIAFATAMHNSIFTLLLGIPFERALWYHKLAGRIAFINAILHTYVSFDNREEEAVSHLLGNENHEHGGGQGSGPDNISLQSDGLTFFEFTFSNQINISGTMLFIFLAAVMLTSVPIIRRRVFELFYYTHIIFVIGMIGCAFYHTGILVPILASVFWGGDVLLRKAFMASVRYPKQASIRTISDSVVELSFPKNGFDFNPGQYIYLAVPELSLFEWHPFSLSSSPRQKLVSLHIRKAGAWTKALFDLAKNKKAISILFEGPYGSLGVDLMNRDRYRMVMLFSGGVGVTPMMSVNNQLLYEHSIGQRELKKLSFIWIERDPIVMKNVDIVRRTSSIRYSVNLNKSDDELRSALDRVNGDIREDRLTERRGLASTILSLAPVSGETDEQLETEFPSIELDEGPSTEPVSLRDRSDTSHLFPSRLHHNHRRLKARNMEAIEGDGAGIEGSSYPYSSTPEDSAQESASRADMFFDQAYLGQCDTSHHDDLFDLQVYLTDRQSSSAIAHLPFVRVGRPDVKNLFQSMKGEAIANGERRVAVCVCAPPRVVDLCRKASIKYSDRGVRFDVHEEIFS